MILKMVIERNFDLIFWGTDIKPGSEKLYICAGVERVLNNASCSALVINSQ
jgi:hypothetical protein